MKRIIVIVLLLVINYGAWSQVGVVYDPKVDISIKALNYQVSVMNSSNKLDQAKNLQNALDGLKVAKQALDTARKIAQYAKQGVQIYNDMLTMQKSLLEGNVLIDGINVMKLSNMKEVASRALCINVDDLFPKEPKYAQIFINVKASMLNCGSQNLYDMTYAGFAKKITQGYYDKKAYEARRLAPTLALLEIQKIKKEFNEDNAKSNLTLEGINVMSSAAESNLAATYLTSAEDLEKTSIELMTVVNLTGPNAVPMSNAERLMLRAKAKEMHVRSVELKDLGYARMKQSAKKDEETQKALEQQEFKLYVTQLLNTHLYGK